MIVTQAEVDVSRKIHSGPFEYGDLPDDAFLLELHHNAAMAAHGELWEAMLAAAREQGHDSDEYRASRLDMLEARAEMTRVADRRYKRRRYREWAQEHRPAKNA